MIAYVQYSWSSLDAQAFIIKQIKTLVGIANSGRISFRLFDWPNNRTKQKDDYNPFVITSIKLRFNTDEHLICELGATEYNTN
jgi:hypothetical protein